MSGELRRRLVLILMIIACLGSAACGGEGGEVVTGDSPEGIDPSRIEQDGGPGGEPIPQGGAGVEIDQVGDEETLTDSE